MLETNFTPLTALAGGLIIGLAAVLLLLTNGRLAGISTILKSLVSLQSRSPRGERGAFLAGMVAGPLAIAATVGLPEQILIAGPVTLALAGVLVGVGTVTGSGCTSGHGVCGIARLSPRSLIATLVFVGVAGLTVFVTRHLVGGA
ncbi:MAG: YeeE/YedE family protein [Alphaproteobacteria bacterium]